MLMIPVMFWGVLITRCRAFMSWFVPKQCHLEDAVVPCRWLSDIVTFGLHPTLFLNSLLGWRCDTCSVMLSDLSCVIILL